MTEIRRRWISAWLGAAALGVANGVSREVLPAAHALREQIRTP